MSMQDIFGLSASAQVGAESGSEANCGSCIVDDGRSDQWWWPDDRPTC